jgi:hypothetical protein
MAPLLSLPAETLITIASFVSAKDLFSFRATCRRLEQASRDSFAADFFEVRRIFIGQFSLDNLTTISQSVMANYVKKIIIYMIFLSHECIPIERIGEIGSREEPIFGPDAAWERPLKEAVLNFPACTAIEVRDFYGSSVRPDSGSHWRPFGISTERRASHLHRPQDNENLENGEFVEIILEGLLRILAERAGRGEPIKALEMITRSWENSLTFNVFHSVFRPVVGSSMLVSLSTLMLNMEHVLSPERFGELDASQSDTLRMFFDSLPNLKWLRVNGRLRYSGIATCPYWYRYLHSFHGRALKRLELGFFEGSVEEIRGLMKSLKGQLDHVVLHKLFIPPPRTSRGVWKDVLDAFRGSGLKSVTIRL